MPSPSQRRWSPLCSRRTGHLKVVVCQCMAWQMCEVVNQSICISPYLHISLLPTHICSCISDSLNFRFCTDVWKKNLSLLKDYYQKQDWVYESVIFLNILHSNLVVMQSSYVILLCMLCIIILKFILKQSHMIFYFSWAPCCIFHASFLSKFILVYILFELISWLRLNNESFCPHQFFIKFTHCWYIFRRARSRANKSKRHRDARPCCRCGVTDVREVLDRGSGFEWVKFSWRERGKG